MSKLMRISEAAAQQLEALSELTGQSKQKVLDQAITRYSYEQILRKSNEQYAALKKDSKACAEMQAELTDWNATLKDGIDDDQS